MNSRILFSLVCFFLLCGCESDDAKFARMDTEAKKYVEEEKLEEARITLQSLVQMKPKEAELYFRLAEVQVKQRKFKQAVTNYRDTIELQPDHRKANLNLGALFLIAGEEAQAEGYIRKVLEKHPEDLDGLATMANLHSRRRNFDKAETMLDKILVLDPDNVTGLAGKADVALSRNDFKEAEELLTRALNKNPKNGPIQLAIVDLYVKQGRYQDAEELLGSLVEQEPDNSSLRYYYGEFLLTKGSAKDSIQHFKQTVDDQPKRHIARDRLYDIYLFNGEPEKAKALTVELQQALPDSPALSYFKGRNFELDGNYQAALKEYLGSIQTLPNFAPAFRRVGISELKLGKVRDALEHLNQAVAIDSYDVGARLSLAQHFFKERQVSTSKEHVNKVLERFPFQIGANIIRADIALVEDDTDRARKVYQVLMDNYPNSPTGFWKMGLLEEKEGAKAKAIPLYRKALEKDSGVWFPLRRLTSLLRETNGRDAAITEITALRDKSKRSKAEYNVSLAQLTLTKKAAKEEFKGLSDEAKKYLDLAVEENPSFFPAYSLRAQLDAIAGDVDASIADYRKLIELKPKQKNFRLLLAMTLERQKKLDEAEKEYRSLLDIDPRFGPAANNLAWILAEEKKGNLDEALKLALVAKEALPKESAVSDTLGWVYFKKGSNRAALSFIKEAIEIEENQNDNSRVNPELFYHLGEVESAMGNSQAAKEAFEMSLKMGGERYPRKSEIENKIKGLS